NMQAIHKILLDYVVPVELLAILGACALVHFLVYRLLTNRRSVMMGGYHDIDDTHQFDAPNICLNDNAADPIDTKENCEVECDEHETGEDEEEHDTPEEALMRSTWYWRYGEALMGGLLMVYEGVTTATMQLLNCVDFQGELRIYRAAQHVCFAPWQKALFG